MKELTTKNKIKFYTYKKLLYILINLKLLTYNHDKVFEVMKDKLEVMPCFIKYKSYTASNNVPLVAREICE